MVLVLGVPLLSHVCQLLKSTHLYAQYMQVFHAILEPRSRYADLNRVVERVWTMLFVVGVIIKSVYMVIQLDHSLVCASLGDLEMVRSIAHCQLTAAIMMTVFCAQNRMFVAGVFKGLVLVCMETLLLLKTQLVPLVTGHSTPMQLVLVIH